MRSRVCASVHPRASGAARGGEGGKLPPIGGRPKIMQYVCAFTVMELLRITRQIHCKAVEQRATLIHRQYNRDWGTLYSRPPIDPYLTFPPVTKSWRRHCLARPSVRPSHPAAARRCCSLLLWVRQPGDFGRLLRPGRHGTLT